MLRVLKSEFGVLRSERQALRSEFQALRSEFGVLRSERQALRSEFQALRSEFRVLRSECRDQKVKCAGGRAMLLCLGLDKRPEFGMYLAKPSPLSFRSKTLSQPSAFNYMEQLY